MTNTTYLIWIIEKNKLEPAIIWKLVTCQGITSEKYWTSMGRHLSRDTVRWYWSADHYLVLTAVNWSMYPWQITCNHFSPGLLKWLESVKVNIGFPVLRTDGRSGGQSVGVRSRDYQMFWYGQVSLAMGLRPRVSAARAWSSAIKIR